MLFGFRHFLYAFVPRSRLLAGCLTSRLDSKITVRPGHPLGNNFAEFLWRFRNDDRVITVSVSVSYYLETRKNTVYLSTHREYRNPHGEYTQKVSWDQPLSVVSEKKNFPTK